MSNENQSENEMIEDAGAEMEMSVEEAQIEESTGGAADAKQPAWEAFTAGLKAHAEGLGLQVTEQKGFVKFVNGVTGHKLYASKGNRAVKRIDTTLPILGQPNTLPLEKANGKIECHVIPDVEAVKEVLTLLAGDGFGSLRASKRAAKADAPTTV